MAGAGELLLLLLLLLELLQPDLLPPLAESSKV